MDPLKAKGRVLSCDLNVPRNGSSKLSERLEWMAELGWQSVAITTYVTSGDEIPPPIEIKDSFGLECFQRVTVEIETQKDKYNVRSGKSGTAISLYDVICLLPKNEKVFHDCCKEIDCDMITFDMKDKLDFVIRRGAVSSALQRNVQFEFNYSSWFRDPLRRKNEIQLACRIGELSAYKGVILSSDARLVSEIRSPSDAAALMTLASFPENSLPHLTKKNPLNCLVNAFKRKTGKCAIVLKRKSTAETVDDAKKIRTS